LRCEHAEKRRFLPAVEMTDSLRRTFCESVFLDELVKTIFSRKCTKNTKKNSFNIN